MKINFVSSFEKRKNADCLIVPFWIVKDKKVSLAINLKKFTSLFNMPIHLNDFGGKEGEAVFIYLPKEKEKRLLLLGLGEKDKLTDEVLRFAYASAVKMCHSKKIKKANIFIPEGDGFLEPSLEGVALSNYSFDRLRHDVLKENPTVLLEEIFIIHKQKEYDVNRLKKIVAAVFLARDLVNNNADDETPEKIAETAKEMEKLNSSISVEIFDKKMIEKEKMGLLLAVNKGSAKEPVFIVAEYKGNPSSKDKTAFIGKGITYDTGGLSLKPSDKMDTMKSDMAGAATVLALLYLVASLKLKVNICVLIPLSENDISATSCKPGDVYFAMSGKSVEIKNTDAEGRLILADAINYAVEKVKPNRIIDLATLTGAAIIALGEEIACLFSNDDELASKIEVAAKKTGEHVWRMPLYLEYKKMIKSDIADIKNTGEGGKASSITAALFLEEFVKKDMPWAHLDIAGPAFLSGAKRYLPQFATGFGVRLLLKYLESMV
jgi:leucyl aminopeptidase